MPRKTLFLYITALAVIAELIALLAGDFENNMAAKIIPIVYLTALFVWFGVYVEKKKRQEKYRAEKYLPRATRVYDAKSYEQVTTADDGKIGESE